jgi:hypothetical protein
MDEKACYYFCKHKYKRYQTSFNALFLGFVCFTLTLMASEKVANCCVALHPSSLWCTGSTPHSSGFALLEFDDFCLAIAYYDFLREYQL